MKMNIFSKSVAILIAAVMLLAVLALPISAEDEVTAAPTYTADTSWEGTGEEKSPYLINTPEELLGFASKIGETGTNSIAGKHFKLMADIDLNPGYTGGAEAPPNKWTQFDRAFSGTFDGNGHTISGIYLTSTNTNKLKTKNGEEYTTGGRVGIFGAQLYDALTVTDLAIVNSYINGQNGKYIGGIIGLTGNSSGALTLKNLYMDVNITSEYLQYYSYNSANETETLQTDTSCGGLLGRVGGTAAAVIIENCVVAGNITSGNGYRIGGFIGETETTNNNVSIKSSAFYGNINIKNSEKVNYVGGLVGVVTKAPTGFTVDNCIMAGDITFAGTYSNCGNVLKTSNAAATLSITDCLYVDVYGYNKAINPQGTANITDTNNIEIVAADITGLAALDIIDTNAWKASPENGYPLPTDVYYMLYAEAEDKPGDEATKFVGYQASKAVGNHYDLRLVAVLTEGELDNFAKLGFKVKLSYTDPTEGLISASQEKEIYTVYSSIYAKVGSTDETLTYTAEELGGKYIFALVIEDIPTSIDRLTVDVSTFHVANGSDEQVTGSTSKVTINTSSLIGDAQ